MKNSLREGWFARSGMKQSRDLVYMVSKTCLIHPIYVVLKHVLTMFRSFLIPYRGSNTFVDTTKNVYAPQEGATAIKEMYVADTDGGRNPSKVPVPGRDTAKPPAKQMTHSMPIKTLVSFHGST